MENALLENTSEKYLIYPKFLFYYDCSHISFILKTGLGDQYDISTGYYFQFYF